MDVTISYNLGAWTERPAHTRWLTIVEDVICFSFNLNCVIAKDNKNGSFFLLLQIAGNNQGVRGGTMDRIFNF